MRNFADVRDLAIAIGRASMELSVEEINMALIEAREALNAMKSISNHSLYKLASNSPEKQIEYLELFRQFRSDITKFDPQVRVRKDN